MTSLASRLAAGLAAFATAALPGARVALAANGTPGEVHTVFWQSDLSHKAAIEQFLGCLTESSSFTPTWSGQFGISTVTYDGSTVLSTALPASVVMGGNLDQIVNQAFDQGLLPAPKPGVANEYLLMIPMGTSASDTNGVTLCQGSGACGEHGVVQYKNMQYDYAMVPLECPDCGGGLDGVTAISEHEAAEGLADLGTASYEVGDGCESQGNFSSIACCGTQYAVQQLAGPGGPNDCQTITATGAMCACGPVRATCEKSSDCCTGLACKPQATADGGTPTLACCDDLGGACTSSADCCGALQCSSGHCACVGTGQACASTADCCSGLSCDGTTHRCTAPAPPDAGTSSGGGSGSSSGGGSGSGSGSGAGGSSGAGSSSGPGGGSGGSGGGFDAGQPGAGDGGADEAPRGGAAGCGCRVAGAGGEPSDARLLACALAALAALLRQNRRPHRHDRAVHRR